MSSFLKRTPQFQEDHIGSGNEVDTGYYCFSGSLSDTDSTEADTNEFLGLLFKTGVGGTAASGLNEDFVPLGSYLSLNTGYEKEHESLAGYNTITTGRYEALATGGYAETQITKSFLETYLGNPSYAPNFKAKYDNLINPQVADAESLDWTKDVLEFNYAIKQFCEMPMTSTKLSSGWTFTPNVDESSGEAIAFRIVGDQVTVREPAHDQQVAYDYYVAEKGGAGLSVGVSSIYYSFDVKQKSEVWGVETTLSDWPVLTTDKDADSEEEVDVSDALIAAGLSRPVSLSLADGSTSVTLISPYEILYQERADDLEQRGIETVLTSEGVLRPSVAVNKMILEWTAVPVLNFLPKDQVLTRTNIYDLQRFGTTKVWVNTTNIYWDGVPMMNSLGEMQRTMTRGHKFNFSKGITVNLGATNGYDLAVGQSYEYSNTLKASTIHAGSQWRGWTLAKKEDPELAPKSGGMQFLGVMGAGFPSMGNLGGMVMNLFSPSFWADVTDPDKGNNQENSLTANSFFTGGYTGPAMSVSFNDSIPKDMSDDVMQAKTIGPTFAFHSGNIETVQESADGQVVLKSKWKNDDITESRVFVNAESNECIEQRISDANYTNYQSDTLAAITNTTDHSFIGVSGTQAAIITNWEFAAAKIEFDKPDVELELRLNLADADLEYGVLDLESGYLPTGNSELSSHVAQLQAEIDAIKTKNQTYINMSEAKLAAASLKQSGITALNTKLNEARAQLNQVKTNLKHTNLAVKESEAAAIDALTYGTALHMALIANNADPGV